MTAVSYDNLRTRALQVMNETAGFANDERRVGGLLRDLVDSLSAAAAKFNVRTYIAAGTGSLASPAAAFAAADAAAAAVGGTVYVPAGTYGDGTGWTFALSSGVTLEGDGDVSNLVNCQLTATGTAGNEIAFTGAATKGATSISIPATGLTDSYLRLSSVINCQSSDAGVDQLGTASADASFFGEFVRVKTGNAATADLYGALVFPYSNTAGGSSGSFTTSVARVMSFHAGGRIRRLRFTGIKSGATEIILGTFCRDLCIEECYLDTNNQTANLIRLKYCLDCEVRGPRGFGKRTSITGATQNLVIISSSQNTFVDKGALRYGYQAVDVTYQTNDATYRGGPSIACGARGTFVQDAGLDGFTSHYGCYMSFFDDVTSTGHPNVGVRIRSRGDRVSGGRFTGGTSSTGILIDNAAAVESHVSGPYVNGGARAIQYDHSSTGLEALEAALGCGACIITKPICRGQSGVAIYCATAYTSATLVGPRIIDPEIHQPGSDAIRIDPYNNGTVVKGVRANGIPAARAAVTWGANIKRLHVDDIHAYGVNASGFALKGPATGSFMTDATTFPAGESEAQLYLGKVYTDAATPFSGIYRDTGGVAYLRAQTAGWQPNVGNVAPATPTLSTAALAAWYLSGTEMFGKSVDAAGTTTRTYALVMTNGATPEGAITAPVGRLCIDTATGILYAKTSGSGNTGWMKVSAT